MKTINEAAEEYAKKMWCEHIDDLCPHSDETLGEVSKIDFIAGANAQQEIDSKVMYDYNELIVICEKLTTFLMDKMQGQTKMKADEFLLTLKKDKVIN